MGKLKDTYTNTVSKLPFGDSMAGMVLYGLAGFQLVGMLTGQWNIIPGMGRKMPSNFPDIPSSQYSSWAFASQVAPGVGGIRFGGKEIQDHLKAGKPFRGPDDAQKLARQYPGAPKQSERRLTGWKDEYSGMKKIIASLRA